MKPPEEIKKGLSYCANDSCLECPYDLGLRCGDEVILDALAYIHQLESRIAQVERERDAAVNDLKEVVEGACGCDVCGKSDEGYTDLPPHCKYADDDDCWQWRGVCDDGTGDEA